MTDMASRNLDKANKLYSIAMKNIKLQLNLLGTNFVVQSGKMFLVALILPIVLLKMITNSLV